MNADGYRGRLAPTPSGYLHAGHARTFAAAWRRARDAGGRLVFRIEDIDRERSRAEYEAAAREDLAWLGLDWDEGGGRPGPFAPYRQSERHGRHREAWARLADGGWIYPSPVTRREIAMHATGREADGATRFPAVLRGPLPPRGTDPPDPSVNWRFRVPDGRLVAFEDGKAGKRAYRAGEDFGDFLVWRKDGTPSYELAVVVDDRDMAITEVVRGEDLLLSTARQLLLYEALGTAPPRFRHEPLVRDADGRRLAKTAGSVAIRELRERGWTPGEVLAWRAR